jgi:hypothetical protein
MTGGSSVPKRFLRAVSLAAPLFALALTSMPVTASTTISETNKYGPYEISDESGGPYGANCIYETSGSGELDRINIRPPYNVHSYGSSSRSQWVGWRYIVQRDSEPYNGDFVNYYKSTIVKERVNSNTDPSHFSRRQWFAPENLNGHYRVRIVIFWYKRPHSSTVSGKAVIEYDYYKAKKGASQVREDQDRCLPHY